MSDKIKIIHLGGQDEIGKNLTVVEINNDIFVVDCGIKFPDKTKHGIDFILPRFDYLIENKNRIKAYILTKGDDLLIGGLPYVIKRAPAKVICSETTKIFLNSFCVHHRAKVDFDFDIVNAHDERMIAGHRIRFFPTTSNLAFSFAVVFSTDLGNIVYIDGYAIDSNCDKGYLTNSKNLSDICGEDNLLLMSDASYADRPGYTNPKFKIVPLIERTFKDAQGRIFIALPTNDTYNVEMVIRLAVKSGRKIYAFDEATRQMYHRFIKNYSFSIPSKYVGQLDDVARARPKEVLIIMSGFGAQAYNKIALFASGQYSDKRLKLIPGDTFIIGLHNSNATETLANNAVDELYRNDKIKIIYFNKKDFLEMRPSEEDVKTMLSVVQPKYFMPISAMYTALLASAKIAIDMGINLNHTNIFIADNGMVLNIDEHGARIDNKPIVTGELMVDGLSIGDINSSTLNDRHILGEQGVVMVAAMYNENLSRVTYGPDIQMRGILTLKEGEKIIKELHKLFDIIMTEELKKPVVNKGNIENKIVEQFAKTVRRITLKNPMVISMISEEN